MATVKAVHVKPVCPSNMAHVGTSCVDKYEGSLVEIGPDGKKRLVGPVISLSDPQPGANATLAGGDAVTPPGPDSLQYKLVVKGDALPGPTGRVDDFTWPPVREAMPIVVVPAAAPAKPPVPIASPARTKPAPAKPN